MKNLRIIARAKSAIAYRSKYGNKALIELTMARLSAALHRTTPPSPKIDTIDFYSFVATLPAATTNTSTNCSRKTINWVIPPAGEGSGGHTTIFRFVANLERLGYECRIIVVGDTTSKSARELRAEIINWFFPIAAEVYVGISNAPEANFTFATAWNTAYSVLGFAKTNHRCYFVQDFEPWFYSAGSEAIFAEYTYKLGFTAVTAGEWLKEKLSLDYNMKAHSIGFSCDRNIYRPRPKPPSNHRRIFFYARPPTARRGFELGLLVLNEVYRRMPDIEIAFVGWDVSNYRLPFPHFNHGVVPVGTLAEIIPLCDVALVLSFSNVSLMPLEIMACGVPLVCNRAQYTSWLLNDSNTKLAEPTVADLADALCMVLNDTAMAERLRKAGIETANASTWEMEAQKMSEILVAIDAQ